MGTLGAEGKGLIVVAMNEGASKAHNPHVSYTAEEVAADGVVAVRAGAAMLHFHARAEDGSSPAGDHNTMTSQTIFICQEGQPWTG